MKNIALIAAGAIALTGCATAPLVVPVERSVETTKSKEQVWANLIEFFASNNISIKTIEKDSGIVYAERTFSGAGGLREWADCGASMMAPPIRQTMDLNVFVRDAGGSAGPKTNITVNARFSETRQSAWDNSIANTDCNSLGVLERRIQQEALR